MKGKYAAIAVTFAALLHQAANAQETTGAINLGLGGSNVTDNGAFEGFGRSMNVSGYLRQGLQGGFYVEAEMRNQNATLTQAFDDSLSGSRLFGLRAGKDFGNYTLGGFAAYMVAITDDGTSERRVFGMTGSYDAPGPLSFTGLMGYLDGTSGTDDGGLDGMSQFVNAAFGVEYDVNRRLILDMRGALGAGIMDDDSPRDELALVREISAGASYQFADPALRAYARATYSFLYQGGENDVSDEKRIDVGLIWTFGKQASEARGPSRVELPRYENWLGNAAGVLE